MEDLRPMFRRTLRLVCACSLLAVGVAPACGGNASDPRAGAAGSGGSAAQSGRGGNGAIARAGTAGASMDLVPIECGSKTCTGVATPIQGLSIPPCCSDAETSHCGLDSSGLAMFGASFGEACQPLAQPGNKDATCPDSPSTPVEGTGFSITLPGCCRANNTCGYQLDTVGGLLNVGLGCVDAAPFLDGESPPACGETGAAGAGGDNGLSGAGGDSSGAGAGGDSSGAGAGGDSGSGGTRG
jgi:hypothetical protein